MAEFQNIHEMIKKQDIIGVRRTLASSFDPNLRNKQGWTPIMLAAMEGNTEILELFLAAGGDPNLVNNSGESAVALAALKGHKKALKCLLDYGGRTDVRPHGKDLTEYVTWGGLDSALAKEIIALLHGHDKT